MGKKKLTGAIAIGLAIIIFGVVILYLFLNGEHKKTTYGEEVECTITSVHGLGNSKSVWGYYYDKNGNRIEVEIINTVAPSVGVTSEGYVIPDKPNKVYLKTPVLLFIGSIALSLVLIIGGIVLIISIIIQNANWNLISREGIFTTGEIVSIRRDGAGENIFYIANIRYIDENGEEHFFDDYSDKNNRRIGEQCTVGYAQKKNGRYTAKIM